MFRAPDTQMVPLCPNARLTNFGLYASLTSNEIVELTRGTTDDYFIVSIYLTVGRQISTLVYTI